VLVQADEVIPGLQAFRLERYLAPHAGAPLPQLT
jgi:hypothetical protein